MDNDAKNMQEQIRNIERLLLTQTSNIDINKYHIFIAILLVGAVYTVFTLIIILNFLKT